MASHRRLLFALALLPVLWTTSLPAWTQEIDQRQPLNFAESRRLDVGLLRTGARRTNVVAAVERVKGAVVNIHSERTAHAGDALSVSTSSSRVSGMGTGILIDPRG